jgi:VCBS repeat-containing protein
MVAVSNTVFINEFHYDNVGTDSGEFIEIAGTAGTDLSLYSIVRYNGTTPGAAVVYTSPGTLTLTGIIGNQNNGFGTISFGLPTDGLQNGGNDGFALIGPGNTVIEFLSYEGLTTAAAGQGPAAGLTSTDVGVSETSSTVVGASIARVGTGTTASAFTWANLTVGTPGAVNTGQSFGAVGSTLSINDVSLAEGNLGTTNFTFTVTRSGSTASEVTFDIATADNTATTADTDYVANALTGQSIGAGFSTATFTVAVNGDTTAEPNQSFFVNLSNVTGATVSDGQGIGTIQTDDVVITRIHDIQGAAHTSLLAGQSVTTTGIVTAVDTNGFYLQEADATIDADIATSEGIFVFTSSAPTVTAGQAVNVTGTVTEFFPGGASTGNLSTTEIVSPSITVLSSGNALPTAIVLGAGGRMAPTSVIDNDGLTSFDPTTDGIDFFESLEGMRVTVPSPLAVSATNSFGEIFTVADNGANATGINSRGVIVASGSVGDGLNVTNTGEGADFNPERIQIDAGSFTPGGTPNVNPGTVFADITGVVSYNFGNFEVVPTSAITVQTASTLAKEVTNLTGDANTLTIAAYNAENLDPGDGAARFAAIADRIVNNLLAPDIIALQEIQDNDGATNSTTVSASVTLQILVDAITAAGGPTYSWLDNPFIVDDANGGEPGGNIRVAFLYNDARVDLVGAVSTTPNALVDFAGSRPPLIATFDFAGEEITLVNNHFTSKGGGTPLFGATQNSVNGGADKRLEQAQNVADYVASLDPAKKVIVLGDLNEFTNEESLQPLYGAGLTDLGSTLPAGERYSYVFDGNAQSLDQVFVSANVLPIATLDEVHINAEFFDQISDHDPSVIALNFTAPNVAPVGVDDTSIGTPLVEDGNSAATGNVLTNDTDVNPGDTKSVNGARAGTEAAGGSLIAVSGATIINGTYGQLTINPDGSYSYALDNTRSAVQSLNQGDAVSDVFSYQLEDAAGLTDVAQLTLSIAGTADTPAITSAASFSVAERTTAVGNVVSVDPDAGTTLTYAIAGGVDASAFNINAQTGALSFKTAPVFEFPTDTGKNNVYDVDVSASDGTNSVSQSVAVSVTNQPFTLQLLSFYAESGVLSTETAYRAAGIVQGFKNQLPGNTLVLTNGDTFIPGPYSAAGTDNSIIAVVPGAGNAPARPDIAVLNAIGVDAAAIGNHEFDLGSNVFQSAITPSGSWVGALFPYLSANLNFSGDSFLASRYRDTLAANSGLEETTSLAGRVAPSAVKTINGEKIGIIGLTPQNLSSLSSPTGAVIIGGSTINASVAAAQVQAAINDLTAQGVNKIVLTTDSNNIGFDTQVVQLTRGIDLVVAGGSHLQSGDSNDVARPGEFFPQDLPLVTTDLDGNSALIVSSDVDYKYVNRLVVGFTADGKIELSTLNNVTNGAYSANDANVALAWNTTVGNLGTTAYAAGTSATKVKVITDAIGTVITAKDGTLTGTPGVFGYSNVYLEGERNQVRFQETNLGDLTADANAATARAALGLDAEVAIVSIKNGGGIRNAVGFIDEDGNKLANVGNAAVGKPAGAISQLDVENSLRFNNGLMVFDTTAQGLLNILNSPNTVVKNNGGFIQIGGVRFSYDATKAAGSRVQDVVLVNELGQITARIADNGVVLSGAPALIQGIVLNFTAQGGDSYNFKANADNFRYVKGDGTLSGIVPENLNFTDSTVIATYTGSAGLLGEQKVLADYLASKFGTPGTAFNLADTAENLDIRIQNQAVRTDTVLIGDTLLADATTNFAENDTATAFQGVATCLSGTITYSLIGADAAKFAVDAAGKVTFVAAPDFENPTDAGANNVYDVRVVASNGTNTTVQDVAITVSNVNEAPVGNDDTYAGTALVEDGNNAAAGNVLTNDTDVDAADVLSVKSARAGTEAAGGSLTAVSGATVINGIYGELTINPDGSYSYALDNTRGAVQALAEGVTAFETFTYEVKDADGLTDLAQLTLSIAGADEPLTLIGNAGFDTLTGGGGNDNLSGLAGRDVLIGNGGDDTLDGGANRDTMDGGAGNDTYYVDNVFDVVTEGLNGGTDTIISTLALTLGANVENGTLTNSANIRITGNELDNVLTGNSGNNKLEGLNGNDQLSGGFGADTLIGGLGSDTMTGGSGADRFVFTVIEETAVGAGRDVISDFVAGIDRIVLSTIDADTTRNGNQTFNFIGAEDFTGAGQLRAFASSGNTIVAGDINGDGFADFEIQLTGIHVIAGADFVL